MAISALTREIRLGKGVGESERNTVPSLKANWEAARQPPRRQRYLQRLRS